MSDKARGMRRHPAPPPKEYGPPAPRSEWEPTRQELRDALRAGDSEIRRAIFGRWRKR